MNTFYGPKLEFKLFDCLGREWQCGTIQVDYQLPSAERLDATYIGADNQKHHPIMLHRAVLGSFERFLGILIENFAGNFPAWLASQQVAMIPVAPAFNDYAEEIKNKLLDAGFRADADLGPDNMKGKIKAAQLQKIPYMLVVGEKEKAEGAVAVRFRDGRPQQVMKVDDFIAYIKDKVDSRFVGI